MTTQTPATAEFEKWLRIRVWKKNGETCRNRLRIRSHLWLTAPGFVSCSAAHIETNRCLFNFVHSFVQGRRIVNTHCACKTTVNIKVKQLTDLKTSGSVIRVTFFTE